MTMLNDVFVSYRRKNIEFVKQVVDDLEARGKTLWVDWDDIPPGVASFNDEIERGINGAHIFIAVLSPDYLESDYCLSELEHATQLNKRIIPIVHEKFEEYPVPKSIQTINWIYFTPHAGQTYVFSTAMDNLLHAIDADYDYIREHTRLLQRALDWKKAQKNGAFLLSGKALNDAETWLSGAANKSPIPTALHTDYIVSSRRRQSRQQGRLLLGTTFLLALAVIALLIAIQQFMVADRRADETLSLLIADDALNAAELDDPVTALSRIHYANTFLNNPPDVVQSSLQQIAFQPAPRYLMTYVPPDERVFPLPTDTGTKIPINDGAYLLQDSDSQMTVRNASDEILIHFDVVTTESRDDSQIHPDVMAEIQNIQTNSFGPISVGYDVSPDARFVAMGQEGAGILVWNNVAGAGIQATLTEHNLLVDNVQFSSDGQYMISVASELQNVNFGRSETEYFIWDTSNWTVIQRLSAFDLSYQLAGISPDLSHLIFSNSSSHDIIIWDNRNPALLWQIETLNFVQDIAFAADNENLIASTVLTRRMAPPDNITIYNLQTADQIAYYDGTDSNHIIGLPILQGTSSDALRLLLNDGTVSKLTYRSDTVSTVGTIAANRIDGYSENGRFIASVDYDTTEIVLYDLDSAEEIARVPYDGWLGAVSISPNGQYLAYTLENPDNNAVRLIIYNAEDQVIAAELENVSTSYVTGTHLFGADGRFVYFDRDNVVHILSANTWQEEQPLLGFLQPINHLAYNSDTQHLAAGGANGTVILWDTVTGSIILQLDNIGNGVRVALAQTGDRLATGNEDGQISLWRLFSPEEALAWVEDNRVITPLSCSDRVRYGIGGC